MAKNNKPTIIQFESDDFYQVNLELLLDSVGLDIAQTIGTIDQAKSIVSNIESGKLKPDVVIVSDYFARDWHDGEWIASRIRKISPRSKIVSYSIARDIPDWADAHAVKSGLDNARTIITALKEVLGVELQPEVKDEYD